MARATFSGLWGSLRHEQGPRDFGWGSEKDGRHIKWPNPESPFQEHHAPKRGVSATLFWSQCIACPHSSWRRHRDGGGLRDHE
ncbi:hypothetical protein HZH66_010146 [Vespula vulgaris]|uniref:Uncharacterized protein n=1 Tax=Vespula vulgaris TaxID=7454 RepID=A0A834JL90_VESVU|nr:hypothetical protein HZH66_010146 [Vespula vulgaris]